MNKIFVRILIACSLTIVFPACKKNIPVMEINKTHIGFKIKKGVIFKTKFKITNIGNAPLQILTIVSDCDCTIIKKYPKVIYPKHNTDIQIAYNSNLGDGLTIKRILIRTNAEPQLSYIELKGIVL